MPEYVGIFRNRKTGGYLLQRTCPDPVLKGPVPFGDPEKLSEQDLRLVGVKKILEALSFSSEPCRDPAQLRKLTEEEYRDFRRQYDCVSVTRWPGGQGDLEVRALQRVRGGYRSIDSKKVVSKNNSAQFLIDTVLEAFKQLEKRS